MRKKFLLLLLVFIFGIFIIITGCESSGTPAPDAGEATGSGDSVEKFYSYLIQPHIHAQEPIIMREPFLEIMGQADQPIAYYYQDIVKIAGHSSGATAGAWVMLEKALDLLYPGDEIPVRGHIIIHAPAPADQWEVGVFGEMFTMITAASPSSGFPGSAFGEDFNRRYLLKYPDEKSDVPFPMMDWIFERKDTGKKVSIGFNLFMVQEPSTPAHQLVQGKLVRGEATDEEVAGWQEYWNKRSVFIFENADKLPGLFRVQELN